MNACIILCAYSLQQHYIASCSSIRDMYIQAYLHTNISSFFTIFPSFNTNYINLYLHLLIRYGGTDISLGQRPEHLSFLRCHELYKEHSLPTATHGSASASSLTSKLEAMETEETMKKGSESETEGGKDGGREDTDGGGGMMGWMTSRLKPQPPQAFLGRKNAYRYFLTPYIATYHSI